MFLRESTEHTVRTRSNPDPGVQSVGCGRGVGHCYETTYHTYKVVAPLLESITNSFRELIEAVPRESRELQLYVADPSDEAVADIAAFFDLPRSAVTIHGDSKSKPEVVLTANGESLLEASIDELWEAVTTTAEVLQTESAAGHDAVSLIDQLETSTFRSQSVPQLVVASRYVERRAERQTKGTLYACFQHLSRVNRDLRTMLYYNILGRTDLDVHLFGLPDRTPLDTDGLLVHDAASEELARTWLVAYDGDGRAGLTAALLAEEIGPRQYRGFWTQEPDRVDEIIGYLIETYLS
jgi:DICT domain-containing protein